MNSNQLFEKIENSKKPDFGDVLSKSFEMYKKTFSIGLVHVLISLALAIPFILIIYIPLLPFYIDMIQNSGDPYYQPEFLEGFSVIMIIVWILLVFVLSFVLQVFNISIYGHFLKVLKNEDLGLTEETGGYFTIAKNHFGKIILISLANMGIALVAALACYFPVFYVMVPLQLVIPIFIFNQEMSVGDIIKAAFKLGNKYWLVFFGLILVSSIFSALGLIVCYIGIIATMFFSYIVIYYMYKDTVGFDEEESQEEDTLLVN
ncbi:hypothetical protein [Aquimarina sp. MMG016]|uniref:hypothetical protein n=1 Tax=Aquimarina sp. MMG016 TaxID=2822690 RepID=UPI001B3A6040|nr:hypothetical protein [Aquimarina sp. MMG016]MBQ4820786.1 hypothetical protein [Aquimarina sp. MMG016]